MRALKARFRDQRVELEGAEFEIFKGAERILRRHAPLLVFACENRYLTHGSVGDVFAYLESLGYQGSFVCHDEFLSI